MGTRLHRSPLTRPCSCQHCCTASARRHLSMESSQQLPGLCRQLIKFLSTEARRAGTLREKLEKVEVWTQQRRIPSSLTRRIRAYYAEIWLDYAGAPSTASGADWPHLAIHAPLPAHVCHSTMDPSEAACDLACAEPAAALTCWRNTSAYQIITATSTKLFTLSSSGHV